MMHMDSWWQRKNCRKPAQPVRSGWWRQRNLKRANASWQVTSSKLMGHTMKKEWMTARSYRGKRKGTPHIGDKVWIGVNSTIVGSVVIGDDVLIAPNTYINCDVPAHSVVFGNPCIIKHVDNATKDYVNHIAQIWKKEKSENKSICCASIRKVTAMNWFLPVWVMAWGTSLSFINNHARKIRKEMR